MQGILPSPVELNPSTIEYELEERATVTRLLLQPLDDLKLDEMFRVRIQLVQALAQLCKHQETPYQFKKSAKIPRPTRTADMPMDIGHPAPPALQLPVAAVSAMTDLNAPTDGPDGLSATPDLYCPFCKWSPDEIPPLKRNHLYARPDSLGRHIRDQHLAEQPSNEGFDCPYEGCSAFIGGAEYFLNHTARQHKLTLWCATWR